MPLAKVGDCVKVPRFKDDEEGAIYKVKTVVKGQRRGYDYEFCNNDDDVKTCHVLVGQHTGEEHEKCSCQKGGRRTKRSTRRAKRSSRRTRHAKRQ